MRLARRLPLRELFEIPQPADACQFLTVDHVDQTRQVARAAQRDLQMQLIAQRRCGRGAEHPGFEILDTLVGRLVDHPRRSTLGGAGPHLPCGADELVAAQLVKGGVDTGRRKTGGTKALLQTLRQLISITGALDHEAQYCVLRRQFGPSSRTFVQAEGIPNSGGTHTNRGMNQMGSNSSGADSLRLSESSR